MYTHAFPLLSIISVEILLSRLRLAFLPAAVCFEQLYSGAAI